MPWQLLGRSLRPGEVEHAVALDAGSVHVRVLAMGEPDARSEFRSHANGIDSLPPEVARIEVDSDRIARDRPEQFKGRWVVDGHPRMELEAEHHSRCLPLRPSCKLAPVRSDPLL